MKKKLSILSLGISAFILGLSFNNFALSDVSKQFSVATVDIQKIITNSTQVNNLREEQKQKRIALVEFAKKARADVEKETDKAKQKDLEAKYNKQLNTMKTENDEDYQKKLKSIDSNITKAIATKAKANGYDIVLAKNVILYGGSDITDEIAKEIK